MSSTILVVAAARLVGGACMARNDGAELCGACVPAALRLLERERELAETTAWYLGPRLEDGSAEVHDNWETSHFDDDEEAAAHVAAAIAPPHGGQE